MITKVKGLKVSQLTELKDPTGKEMIPYQYSCTNGKVSIETLAQYVVDSADIGDGSGSLNDVKNDIRELTNKVNNNTNRITDVEEDVTRLENKVDSITSVTPGTTNYNDLINKPSINGVTLQNNKTASDLGLVSAESGKGLSTNDYTTAEKNKLASLSNYNDSELRNMINNVSANIPDRTSDLINDSNFVTSSQVDNRIQNIVGAAPEALDTLEEVAARLENDSDAINAINGVLSGKVNSSDVYTKTEVDAKIDEAITGGTVDLSNYYTKSQVDSKDSQKVDKVAGKGLSTNDYTTPERNKLASLENYDDTELRNLISNTYNKTEIDAKLDDIVSGGGVDLSNYYTKSQVDAKDNQKVDKVAGKGLSTNDYTTAEKTKLAGLSNYDDSDIKASIANTYTKTQVYTKTEVDNKISAASQNKIDKYVSRFTDSDRLAYQGDSQVNIHYEIATYDSSNNTYSKTTDFVTIGPATSTEAGVMTAADKAKLDNLSTSGGSSNSIDTYTKNIEVNLAYTATGATMKYHTQDKNEDGSYSDTVRNVYLGSATVYDAGLMRATDKQKLDSIDTSKLVTTDSSGKIPSNLLPDGSGSSANFVETTYKNLYNLATNNQLVPGCKYAITDYTCSYGAPVWSTIVDDGAPIYSMRNYEADDWKYIICTAITSSELNEDVDIVINEGYQRYKIVACKYTIDSNRFDWTAITEIDSPNFPSKGCIYYLEDENGNAACYDFKHVKFPRWSITNITANTTVDTGSNTNCSPYRVYTTDTTRAVADNRTFIGSGDPIEATMIPAIFNGTWRQGNMSNPTLPELATNPGLATPILPFTTEHINNYWKPWSKSTGNYSYMAWTTMMNTQWGLSGVVFNTSNPWIGNLCNVEVSDKIISKWFYTFDYNGEDASEIRVKVNDSEDRPKYGCPVFENKIITNTQTTSSLTQWPRRLPNIVIQIDDGMINKIPTGSLEPEKFTRNKCWVKHNTFKGEGCRDSSIFLLGVPGKNNTKIGTIAFNTFELFHQNVIYVDYQMCYNNLYGFYNSYACGALYKCNMSMCRNNVLFGHIQSVTADNFYLNLWYNSNRYINKVGDSSGVYSLCQDGEYTYDTSIRGFNMSNILGPMQYATLYPHFNSNTFRQVYNKGFIIESANQLNSYGQLCWGTHLSYGFGQGIKFGALLHTTISPSCLGQYYMQTANGISKIDPNKVSSSVPYLRETDITCTWSSNPYKIRQSIGDSPTPGYPASKARRILYVSDPTNDTWTLLDGATLFNAAAGITSVASNNSIEMNPEEQRAMYESQYENENISEFPEELY